MQNRWTLKMWLMNLRFQCFSYGIESFSWQFQISHQGYFRVFFWHFFHFLTVYIMWRKSAMRKDHKDFYFLCTSSRPDQQKPHCNKTTTHFPFTFPHNSTQQYMKCNTCHIFETWFLHVLSCEKIRQVCFLFYLVWCKKLILNLLEIQLLVTE